VFVYDMTALGVALAALMGSSSLTRSDGCLVIVVWCLPALAIVQPTMGPLLCVLVLLSFVGRLTSILFLRSRPVGLQTRSEPTSVRL
jgi:hypothetical protein